MNIEQRKQVVTNDLFKGYFVITSEVNQKFEEGLEWTGYEKYAQANAGHVPVTIYNPDNFGTGSIYQLTVQRKLIDGQLYRRAYFSEWAYQSTQLGIEEQPAVLPLSVLSAVVSTYTGLGLDVDVEVPEVQEITEEEPAEEEVPVSIVTSIPEKVWRKLSRYNDSEEVEYNSYKLVLPMLPSELAELHEGSFLVTYNEANSTFTVELAEKGQHVVGLEVLGKWIKEITGWCSVLDRILTT